MSLFGSMRTASSGMNAQATRLSTVSDNIANVSTTGYKQASAEFESLVTQAGTSDYASGAVTPTVRMLVGQQGTFRSTSNPTDLAISGGGFFVVKNDAGATFLTRAGAFVPDAKGNLVNTAGYQLAGYPLNGSLTGGGVGLGGLVPVNIGQLTLTAKPSTEGSFTANLPSSAPITAGGDLPSTNSPASQVTGKSSMIAYDNLGTPIKLDVYLNKTADNTWEVTVFNQADAAVGGSFPYVNGPLVTQTLTFDPANGMALSGKTLSIAVPNGQNLNVDLSQTTQLATSFSVVGTQVNGNAPSSVQRVEVDEQGVLYSIFENGTRTPSFRIPLANVRSPDNLTQMSGNVFAESAESGTVVVGDAKTGGLGKIVASSLEESTVDLASELATMIESQRGYTANSKVFQTSAELVDVLVNLK